MKELRTQLLRLEHNATILEPNAEVRKKFMNHLEEYAGEFIENLDTDLSFRSDETKDPDRLKVNGQSKDLSEILHIFKEEVDLPGLNPASGGHLGYIPGGGIFATAMGDFIAAISNRYAGLYFGSPGAVRLENRVIDWMKDVCGYPSSALGNLTSGGSIANLIAITAARDHHEVEGAAVEKAVIYLSEQTHHCVHKAVRIAGLGKCHMRNIPLDANYNIRVDSLEEMINIDLKNGLKPFLVVASAGTTNIGNIDPLDKIADITEAHNLWFHVDAAYGGFFIMLDELKHKFKGMERSDSLVIDPHKGLFLAYGLGAVLIKNKAAMLKSHHYRASYLQDAVENDQEYSPADLSPELTKHFRGLRLWLPLQLYGVEVFQDALREKRGLCLYFLEGVRRMGFEIGPEPDLSVGIFRYNPINKDANEFNKILMKEIHKDGRVFLSSTIINEQIWIRVAVLSFRTHVSTVEKCFDMLEDCLERTKSLM
ncbi:pyridoxal phosphate-dependent decarboxylase family protein [Portibacter lacus]|uniref:Pyridoxal-dependent decarboxylase n=1 Tax=Portibacter lacus TaxID=1099794 RepID=A0AA37WDF0_9BACT|nr:aminotransferase class V-fold PLP-dependent enzyme [Portibacter lacus]GLR15927.1 pyridoxal-dependent decarboxylase [Portibacter lacus]